MRPATADRSGKPKDRRRVQEVAPPRDHLLGPLQSIDERLERLEERLADLFSLAGEDRFGQAWLTTAEFAAAVNRAEFTVRTWCNQGRLKAEKTDNGRQWRIHRDELLRYRRRGLLPT